MNDGRDEDPTTVLLERLARTFPDRPAPLGTLVEAARAARRRRHRRTSAIVVAVLAAGLAGGVALDLLQPGSVAEDRTDRVAADQTDALCDKQAPRPPSEPVPRGPDYPTNAAGQTYGSARDNSPQPDLVAAVGDCGRTGYILRDAFAEQPPWVPGAGSGEPRSTPVLESDGVTRIDTFTQSRGVPSPGTSAGDAPATGPDAGDVQGQWTATIAGISSGGKEQYDTFRDLDLSVTFDGSQVTAYDGCVTWSAGYRLEDGAFSLTSPFALDPPMDADCARQAPLTGVLENARHVTRSGPRTYLHLADFRIALSLAPGG